MELAGDEHVSGEHCEALGAMVADALDPSEADARRRHIAECRDCGQRLDELAEVRDLLALVPLELLLASSADFADLLP
jgi:hypothetical protein